jgi:RNA polymerase sigma-70 factor, ECF subfamily
VLAVLYLIFNEGHVATSGDALVRDDLCGEAIRLGRLLVELMPDEGEAQGLLALLLLTEARRPARAAADGSLVRLGDQDRSLWDHTLIEEGHALVRACLRRNIPGPYQIQAAIAAVHADASAAAATDWSQIVQLYDQLLVHMPTPIVALNRAIAIAELDGPAPALAIVDDLELDNYYLFHAARADLLHRLDRFDEAVIEYDKALALTANSVERDHLQRRREELSR